MKKNKEIQSSLDEGANRYIKSLVGFATGKIGATVLVCLFFILILILVFGFQQDVSISTGSSDAERKLADIISKIEGVEDAEVMITYESTSKKVPATSDSFNNSFLGLTDENNDSQNIRLVQGSTGNTFIITELEPEIRGVVVVAKGADDYMVKLNIIDAVKTVLRVSGDRVEVLNMK